MTLNWRLLACIQMNSRFAEISRTVFFQATLFITGNLIMMTLFFTFIPAVIIQNKISIEPGTAIEETKKLVESQLTELLNKPGKLEKEYFTLATEKSPAVLLWNNFFWLIAFLLPAVWAYKKFKEPFNNLSDPIHPAALFGGFLVGLFTISFVFTVTRILAGLGVNLKGNDLHEMLFRNLRGNQDLFLWSVYSVGILTGIIEEVFFRGFLFTQFRDKNLPMEGLFFSSVIFGSVHYSPEASIFVPVMLTFVGFIFGYSYFKTGNIWVAITAHTTYNSTLLVIAYLAGEAL